MPPKIKPIRKKKWVNPVSTGLVDFLDYYDKAKLDKCLAKFIEDFEIDKQMRYPHRDLWLQYYQMYRGYSNFYENAPEWQSSYYINKGFEFIETIKPRIMDALYGYPPLWIGIPAKEEMREATYLAETLLDTRKNQTGLYMTHMTTISEVLMYGTAWEKLTYEVTPEYEGTRWIAKDIFDVFPDMTRAHVREMRRMTDRSVVSYDELKFFEKMGVYKGIDKVKRSDGDNKYFSQLDRLRMVGRMSNPSEMDKNFHEVLEVWGKYVDEETDEQFDVVVVIVDRAHIVRFQENPYYFTEGEEQYHYALKPFVKFVDVPVPHEVYGIGELEILQYLQYELNDWRNMRADAAQLAVSPVFQVIRDGLENRDLDKLVFGPGAIISTNFVGTDPVKPVTKDTGFFAAYRENDEIKGEMRDATGVQLPLTGSEGAIRKTATEVVSYINEANSRIKMKVQIMDNYSLPDQARMTYKMEKQFTDTEVLMKIFDVKGVKGWAAITPMQMKWDGDFQLQPLTQFGMRQLNVQRLIQFLEIASKMPQAERRVRFGRLLQQIADNLDIKDRDMIIQDEEANGMIEQDRAAEMAAKGGGAPNLQLLTGGAAGQAAPGLPPELAAMPPTTTEPSAELLQAVLRQIQSAAQTLAPRGVTG